MLENVSHSANKEETSVWETCERCVLIQVTEVFLNEASRVPKWCDAHDQSRDTYWFLAVLKERQNEEKKIPAIDAKLMHS